ncbi:MAG: hypothetical protein ACP5PW_01345 [Candidatus Dormibacteria bacterium]
MAGPIPVLRTRRLAMRPLQKGNREPFAAVNAAPEAMEHFLAPLAREESDSLLDRINSGFAAHGFGL